MSWVILYIRMASCLILLSSSTSQSSSTNESLIVFHDLIKSAAIQCLFAPAEAVIKNSFLKILIGSVPKDFTVI